mgnify:CR=1 FL=1
MDGFTASRPASPTHTPRLATAKIVRESMLR